tara:strand:- start:1246 stop:2190 length:945 start_codon:yes stop_codon:yes gene_type:complete
MIEELENFIDENLIDDENYHIIEFNDHETHFLGINNKKEIALLINNQNELKLQLTPYKGSNLEIFYDKKCKINQEEEKKFTLLHLCAESKNVKKYFVQISDILLNNLGKNPKIKNVEKELESVKEIFLNLKKKIISDEIGLWGEVYFIFKQEDKNKAVSSWHLNPKDRIDFNNGKRKIEIKTTLSSERKHIFKLEQLKSHYEENVLICSIMTEEIENGISIKGLFNKIVEDLDNNHKMKLFQKISSVIGSEIDTMNFRYFDEESASKSIKLYESKEIPALERSDVPNEISNIQFTSNLKSSKPYNVLKINKILS